MLLLNIPQAYRKTIRLIQIFGMIVWHFLSDWFTGTRFYRFFRKPANEEEALMRSTPSRLRELVEDLGPTFIKFGQILADRPDLVSEKFRKELKKLQTSARPIPDEEAIALIEAELEGPLELFFRSFDRKCIASASIGQVYAAELRNGERVVIKIQRPGIYTKIKTDLSLLKILAKKLARHYPELASLNLVSFVDEFGESLKREMNYHYEAANILRFTSLLKDYPAFYAPKVYNEYTTKRLLIMERIDGICPDQVETLREKGYDPEKIAENGAHILLRMVLQHGVFHADPHAGNIFILPGNRICFIDYGMVAVLRPSHIRFLADFTLGFSTRNPRLIAASLIELSEKKFFPFEEDLAFEVQEVIHRYSYIEPQKVDITSVMLDCVSLVVKYELQIPSSIYMLLKALASIQKFAGRLAPDFSLAGVLVPYARKVVMRQYSPRKLLGGIYETVKDYIQLSRQLPRELGELLNKLKEGKLQHEVNLHQNQQFRETVQTAGINFGLAFSVVLLVVSSVLIYATGSDRFIARLAFISAMVLGGWLLLRTMRQKKANA